MTPYTITEAQRQQLLDALENTAEYTRNGHAYEVIEAARNIKGQA